MNNFFSLCTSLQAHRRLLFSLPSFTVSFPFFFVQHYDAESVDCHKVAVTSCQSVWSLFLPAGVSDEEEKQTAGVRLRGGTTEKKPLSLFLSYTHTFLPPTPVYNLPSHTHSTTNPPLSSNNIKSVLLPSPWCVHFLQPLLHTISLSLNSRSIILT